MTCITHNVAVKWITMDSERMFRAFVMRNMLREIKSVHWWYYTKSYVHSMNPHNILSERLLDSATSSRCSLFLAVVMRAGRGVRPCFFNIHSGFPSPIPICLHFLGGFCPLSA